VRLGYTVGEALITHMVAYDRRERALEAAGFPGR
jgi:hypothetical protein